jgi:hypothetical protein
MPATSIGTRGFQSADNVEKIASFGPIYTIVAESVIQQEFCIWSCFARTYSSWPRTGDQHPLWLGLLGSLTTSQP